MKKIFSIYGLALTTSFANATVHTVTVSDNHFSPANLDAMVGDTVKWIVVCNCPHTTTSTTIPSCASPWNHTFNGTGSSYSLVIVCAGTYNYKNNYTGHTGVINAVATTSDSAPFESKNTFLSQNYPNPFSTSTTIKYHQDTPNGILVITDVHGKTISEYQLNNVSGEVTITEDLQSGIYFYLLYNKNIIIFRNKMIVQ